jgi:hypothetical protein
MADFTPLLLHIEHLREEDTADTSSIPNFGRKNYLSVAIFMLIELEYL